MKRFTLIDIPRLLEERRIVNEETKCWEWTGTLDGKGYGALKISGKQYIVSRLAAHVYLGMALDDPIWVLHRCDNPPCFNPEHLFFGDCGDNVRDASAKLRGYVGEANGRAILTRANVDIIREDIVRGISLTEIARRYGVSPSAINNIKRGISWTR